MSNSAIIFSGIVLVMLAVSTVLVFHSMRKYSSRKAEAERRSAEAFEEMNRLTKELRQREAPPAPSNLKPGERLQQMYPGIRRGTPEPQEQG